MVYYFVTISITSLIFYSEHKYFEPKYRVEMIFDCVKILDYHSCVDFED